MTFAGMLIMPSERKIAHAKEKAREELRLTLVVFAFLAFMFCAFLTYRRLVLKEYGISYAHYGAGLIEAAIIAKVILFGQAMNLGKRIEDEPLIISVLPSRSYTRYSRHSSPFSKTSL
jgi:hypothetical protein